jgi:hypothetical protein
MTAEMTSRMTLTVIAPSRWLASSAKSAVAVQETATAVK